jgi:N-acetylglutamate synthase-like GNAT family acetyltransferase
MMLRLATESEKVKRDSLTFAAWGQQLTEQQFLWREQQLRSHSWAQKNMQTWLWLDGQKVLASCETFSLECNVGKTPAIVWAIASVFVESHLRKQGHSVAMLKSLIEVAREQNISALILFSEVGTAIYERVGFQAIPSFDFVVEARPTAQVLTASDNSMFCQVTPGDSQLYVPASAGQLDWHVQREKAYGALLKKNELPFHCANVGDSWATFTAYWKTNELHVTSVSISNARDGEGLIAGLQQLAFEQQLERVRIWDSQGFDFATIPGVQRVSRDDEIAMFNALTSKTDEWIAVERGLWV